MHAASAKQPKPAINLALPIGEYGNRREDEQNSGRLEPDAQHVGPDLKRQTAANGRGGNQQGGPPPGPAANTAEARQTEGGNERHQKTDRGNDASRRQGRRHGIAARAR